MMQRRIARQGLYYFYQPQASRIWNGKYQICNLQQLQASLYICSRLYFDGWRKSITSNKAMIKKVFGSHGTIPRIYCHKTTDSELQHCASLRAQRKSSLEYVFLTNSNKKGKPIQLSVALHGKANPMIIQFFVF